MHEPVEIVDVTLRDGLQNEPNPTSTEQKLALLKKLAASGIRSIQATSFMSPRLVPQTADAEAVAAGLRHYPGIRFSALIPNRKGYERATAAGFQYLDFVMSASDTFNRRNVNRSIEASLEELDEVSRNAVQDSVTLRVGIASAFHCPFEGRTPVSAIVAVVRSIREKYPWSIALSDTDGMAFPDQVCAAVEVLCEETLIACTEVVLHFHDTYGRALANTIAGLEIGVRKFDSSTGGLGGCPFCPGASGNVATEDIVALLEGIGYSTGIDMEKLLDAAELALQYSSRPYQSHLLRAMRPRAPQCDSSNRHKRVSA